jgi:hypothetical protein
MCIADLNANDCLAIAANCEEAASLCTPDQRPLAMRFTLAARAIRGLHQSLTVARFAAEINRDTIKEMAR